MTEPLEVVDLSKSYGDRPALDRVGFHATGGSITAVVGSSGCGKSTLLRILAGMTEPTSGKVMMGGRGPADLRLSKEVGWMAQRPALLPWRTVLDNVALAQTINPRPSRQLPTPPDLVELVGLSDAATAYPGQLSGGMQQRAALARTLAIGAPLWLMDEPFAALDELTREKLTRELLEIWLSVRPTVVWVTHHIPEAVTIADRIVLLTPLPGTVASIIDVGLDRPRDPTSAPFQDVVREARSVLREVAA